jgi:hypothetical protein
MRLPFQSKPKSMIDRAEAAVGEVVGFVRSTPERLEGPRERALAAAGAVAGVAAGLAFWRSRAGQDSAEDREPSGPPTPWKTPPLAQKPPERGTAPATDSETAAAHAAGTRSK